MAEYRRIDDIIKEKREQIMDYEGMIDAWKSVTVKKRQDGTEYSALTNRCISGGELTNKEYTSGKEIAVYFGTAHRWYNRDSIDAFRLVEENRHYIKELMSPAELREAIEARIKLYEGYKANTEKSLAWLEENAKALKQKMENFRAELFEGAPDDIGIRYAFGDIMEQGIKYGFR